MIRRDYVNLESEDLGSGMGSGESEEVERTRAKGGSSFGRNRLRRRNMTSDHALH